MGFKERVKAQRLRLHWTQQELADKIKITNTSISNWEKGVSAPPASTIQLLADTMGVSPFALLGDYTLNDLVDLQEKDPATLTYEEGTALEFTKELLKELGQTLGDSFRQLDDVMQTLAKDIRDSIAEIAPAFKKAYNERFKADGGEDVLWGYQFLNQEGKALLIDYLCGLLRVPSLVDINEACGGEGEHIDTLLSIKSKLKKGA
jgi:transcriptional regulator with XRE-family HTH domain